MQRLAVSADGRRLVTADGKPFFYLADTAWTLPQRLKWDDALHYMHVRRQQGFSTLQIVALDPERDGEMRSPSGDPALRGGDLSAPNEEYFRYLDRLIDAAQHLGLYVVLLPVWGQLVVGENFAGRPFPKTVTAGNAHGFGEWIGRRYADRPHIIWCLGGDRQPVHRGVDYRDVWRGMAEGLVKGVTGVACRHDEPHPAWRELLITYHTCYEMETGEYSTMSYWSDDEAWLSFVMLQSGHGAGTRNYTVVRQQYERERTMPVLDAEPAYEQMPMNWPELFPLHDEWIVRKRAYWALLAGACGHTYGHASVWCMISERERNDFLKYSWYEALERPGASQMTILRNLVESADFERWLPAQEMLAHAGRCAPACVDGHRQAARDRDGRFALVYLTDGGTERVDLSGLDRELFGIWFPPREGTLTGVGDDNEPFAVEHADGWTTVKAPTSGTGADWLLAVSSDVSWLRALGAPRTWGEPLAVE
ncbi:DUF4038 domain-containing protein [Streptomyces heilongjiangensis]|uniref:DUF4038 domain-containing protein n=1 Tax=Streptomyces heilongjiangensis TaxID=945052 RepID=A0ABW1BIK7_9ACTN|nr:DUF4038 domain-containing protein [Streptomyces heilongjiangensis]MDC2951954.1 DUF4038 domain-containing protein [Streptomyces heilongjiangensis]